MKLTDRTIANLKATGKAHKHFDGGGLYMYVSPTGGKLWRMVYRVGGKQNVVCFGAYPAVTLKRARERRDDIKTLLAEGIDPGAHAKEMQKMSVKSADTFEGVAREWHVKFRHTWSEGHGGKILARLEKDIFPKIGAMPIASIKPMNLLEAIRHIESRGALETARRALQTCGKILRYAVANGKAERDISPDLREAIPPSPQKHHASIINPIEVGKLLRAIERYQGQYTVTCALKLSPLVFLRPGELRGAEWCEFDFDTNEWRIPAENRVGGR